MFRLTARLLSGSQYRKILTADNADVFLKEVSSRLNQAQTGQSAASGDNLSYWEQINRAASRVTERRNEISQLKSLSADTSEVELRALAEEDLQEQENILEDDLLELAKVIVPTTEMDVLNKCQIEFTSGAGGQEAMLFTKELLDMYRRYSETKGWKWEPLQLEDVSLGGIRSALIAVSGQRAYSTLRFEAGVHRVQRIPVTDKSRMHTSTASVAVLPEPEEVSVIVPSDSVKIETMRASGPGGQNVNKRSTAVRMTHKETGIAVHCMDERFQHLNIQIAYKRLAAILMQKKVDILSEKFSSDRKLQVGSKARAEKIRTYNFQHDRITDHRIQMQLGNVEEFMSGGESLDLMISRLGEEDLLERLKHIVKHCIIEQF